MMHRLFASAAVVAVVAASGSSSDLAARPAQVPAQLPFPEVREDLAGIPVEVETLEEHPDRYIGLTVSTVGVVNEVLGPRLFIVDDPDGGGEILVGVLAPLVAPVREQDRVTIRGRLSPFVQEEFQRSWNWLGFDPERQLELALQPILVATRMTGAIEDRIQLVDVAEPATPVGTTGAARATAPAPADAAALDRADAAMVGTRVAVDEVPVTGVGAGGVFFVRGPDRHILVLPAERSSIPRIGDLVSVGGIALRMPERIEERVEAPGAMNDEVYVYATQLSVLAR